MKGQFGMMEHLLMAVILLMVIVAALFSFFGFQSAKSKGAAIKDDINNIMLATGMLSKSGLLAKEDGVFDDSKLAGFTQPDGCQAIKTITSGACIKIEKALIGEDEVPCEPANFEDIGRDACNSWTICGDICVSLQSKNSKGLSTPINIFRKLESRTDLGVLTVRLPA